MSRFYRHSPLSLDFLRGKWQYELMMLGEGSVLGCWAPSRVHPRWFVNREELYVHVPNHPKSKFEKSSVPCEGVHVCCSKFKTGCVSLFRFDYFTVSHISSPLPSTSRPHSRARVRPRAHVCASSVKGIFLWPRTWVIVCMMRSKTEHHPRMHVSSCIHLLYT